MGAVWGWCVCGGGMSGYCVGVVCVWGGGYECVVCVDAVWGWCVCGVGGG